MPLEATDINIEQINNGQQFTINDAVTYDLMNAIVQLLMYLKEI